MQSGCFNICQICVAWNLFTYKAIIFVYFAKTMEENMFEDKWTRDKSQPGKPCQVDRETESCEAHHAIDGTKPETLLWNVQKPQTECCCPNHFYF